MLLTLALGFSNIQLANSVTFSTSALVFMRSARPSFSAYHYDLVCCLRLAAIFTSAAKMFSLRSYVQKRWISVARIIHFFLSAGLLGHLLRIRRGKINIFPARAPLHEAKNNSALVLQPSCLLNQAIPSECHFSTDRGPRPFLSDIWAFLVLVWILGIKISTEGVWAEYKNKYIHVRSSNENNIDKRELLWKRLCWETFAISMSAIWAAEALRQWVDLRRWMNSSGWLKDDKEGVIHSFGALFSLFSVFSLVFLIWTALDGNRTF